MFSVSRSNIYLRRIPFSFGCSNGKRLISHVWNSHARIAPHLNSCRNYPRSFSNMNVKSLGNRITIPNKELHPSIEKVADVVQVQSVGRLGGAILYPSLSLIAGSPYYFFLYTPVCVGLHHLAIRDAYQVGRTLIRDGYITNCDKLNERILQEIKKDSDSRYYINIAGDLILTINGSKKAKEFSIEHFQGISLSTQSSNPLINLKVLPHRGSINGISYFHLNLEIQGQVDRILEARRRRFRRPMLLGLAGAVLGGVSGGTDLVVAAVGAAIGLFSNFNSVERETESLWNKLDFRGGIENVISPDFTNKYKGLNKELYLTVSTFGDINFSTEKYFSLRNRHVLKNSAKLSES